MQEPIFDLRDVSKSFAGMPALSQINLRIVPGERVALVGPSGAGKSTLLYLMNGTQFASTGTVHVLGRDISRLSPRALRNTQRQIGTIYQQFHLIDNLSVIHNLNAGHLGRWSFWRALASLIYPLEVDTAAKALMQVGIPEKLYERVDRLSGGQQQRVALARVLVQNPRVILADEPISNLDPERGRDIMNLLVSLAEASNRTLISTLHSLDYIHSHFDRVIGIREGRILFDAEPHLVDDGLIRQLYQMR